MAEFVAQPTRRWRAAFGALLLFAMAAPTYLQVAIAVFAPYLTDEFGLSAGQLGILGTALFLPAALGAPAVGYAVDLLGGRPLAALLFGFSGLTMIGFGLAPSYAWLVVMAVTNGFSMAANNPVTNQLLSVYIPSGQRGLLVGVKQSGVKVSQFLAGSALPLGAVAIGWRHAMLVSGVICLTGILAVYVVLPTPPPSRGRARRTGDRAPIGSMVWRLAAFAFLMAVGQSAVYLYLPLYGYERLQMDVTTAGFTVGVIGFIAIFARIAWGPAAERFATPATPLVILSLGAVLSQMALWSAEVSGVALLWVGAVGLSMTAAVWNTVANFAIIVRGGEQTGRASGVMATAFLAGLSAGPVMAGAMIEQAGNYHLAWFAVLLTFMLASAVAVQWWGAERGRTLRAAGQG